LDDYIVASILLNEILNRVDEKILLEHWRGSKGNLIFAKRIGGYFADKSRRDQKEDLQEKTRP
jgi:uncharacterized membrane protein YkvA (DUF1232 family)